MTLLEKLEHKYISRTHVMSDGELMEATDKIDMNLMGIKPQKKHLDEFGLQMTLSERILKYVEKELLDEGYKNEGIDKEIFDNELIKRSVKWYRKARK